MHPLNCGTISCSWISGAGQHMVDNVMQEADQQIIWFLENSVILR